jgi:fucose permease
MPSVVDGGTAVSRRWEWLAGDEVRVMKSVSCFACFLVYGASSAVLGAALPALAQQFSTSTAHMGLAFTTRGAGYLIGALLSVWLLGRRRYQQRPRPRPGRCPTIPALSLELIACLCLVLSGLSLLLIVLLPVFALVLACFALQGLSFGLIETVVNVSLPALWGHRLQPWTHALFACYGLGSILGPGLVAACGFRVVFLALCAASLLPVAVLALPPPPPLWSSWSLLSLFGNRSTAVPAQPLPTHDVEEREEEAEDEKDYTDTVRLAARPVRVDNDDDEEEEEEKEEEEQQECSDSESERDNNVSDSGNGNGLTRRTPWRLKLLLGLFVFVYVGVEIGFAGWIPACALAWHVAVDEAQAALLVAVFWAAITAGRLLSIPLALCVTAAQLIRCQLAAALTSTTLGLLCMSRSSFDIALLLCALIGVSLSAIFPTLITLVREFGFKMYVYLCAVVCDGLLYRRVRLLYCVLLAN